MIRTVLNWLKLDAQNFIVEVWWALLILWAVLVIVGIVDISGGTLSGGGKAFWIATVLLLPLAGLFIYCIFSLTRADYHMLEFLFRKRKSARRKNSGNPASTSQPLL